VFLAPTAPWLVRSGALGPGSAAAPMPTAREPTRRAPPGACACPVPFRHYSAAVLPGVRRGHAAPDPLRRPIAATRLRVPSRVGAVQHPASTSVPAIVFLSAGATRRSGRGRDPLRDVPSVPPRIAPQLGRAVLCCVPRIRTVHGAV